MKRSDFVNIFRNLTCNGTSKMCVCFVFFSIFSCNMLNVYFFLCCKVTLSFFHCMQGAMQIYIYIKNILISIIVVVSVVDGTVVV